MVKLLEWIDQHNPFNDEVSSLTSLSSGLAAADEGMANCDQVEEVGEKIQKSLDGVAVTIVKMKKSDHVKTLQNMQTGIQVNKNNINIEPSVLFMCCTAIVQRQSEDLVTFNHTNITL